MLRLREPGYGAYVESKADGDSGGFGEAGVGAVLDPEDRRAATGDLWFPVEVLAVDGGDLENGTAQDVDVLDAYRGWRLVADFEFKDARLGCEVELPAARSGGKTRSEEPCPPDQPYDDHCKDGRFRDLRG